MDIKTSSSDKMFSFKDNNMSSSNSSLNATVLQDLIDDHMDIITETPDKFDLALVLLYIPTFVAGIIGNVVLAYVVFRHKRLRNGTNVFLYNLAMADLCVTLICIPMAVGQALYRIWLFGEFMCKLTGFLQGVTVAASVFTIALLSVDRFLAIRHPMVFRRLSTNATAVKLIVIVWLLAIALMVPLFVIRQVAVMDLIPDEPLYFCNEQWPEDHHRQQYDLAQFIIVYTIPGSIICVCYGLIGSELWTEDKDLKRTESETSQGLAKNMMKGRKRVAKMLIALAVMFAICWLPYHIVSLYLDFHPGNTHFLNVLPYTIFLGHSNSALNPILYFYSSKGFRSILVRMFKCRKRPFKQVRRDNIIVRCTRNPGDGTTTAALTRRPFVRILSTTTRCQASRSGSLRLSRSNNSSLKSTSGTLRTSFKSNRSSNSNRLNDHHGPRVSFRDKCNKDNKVDNITNKKDKTDLQSSNQPICPQVHIIEPSYDEDHHNVDVDMPYHKRNFMEATISIPTTINEESSRHNSLVPVSRLSPSPSMQAIHEESVEVTQSGSDKDKFEALTIGITIKSSGASGSSNRELDVTVHNHDNDMHDTHQVIVLAD